MSETEIVKGKLIPVDQGKSESLIDVCKRICDKFGVTGETFDGYDYDELMRDELYNKAVVINNIVYLIESKSFNYEDIFEAEKNDDGSINFLVKFYNGGCGLEEAIEEAVSRI